ncbi:zinc-dependent metalloprotease [soil metagenome]
MTKLLKINFSIVLLFVFVNCIYAQDGYKDIVTKSKKTEGLFNSYVDKADNYLEFTKNSEKKTYLLLGTNLTSMEESGFFAGFQLAQMVIKFQKRGEGIDIVQISDRLLPDTNKFTNYGNEITSRFGPLKIDGYDKDSSHFLAKINSYFTSDVSNLQAIFQQMLGGYYMINNDLTYIEQIKTFPKNIEITVNYGLTSQSQPSSIVPDARSINFRVRYSLIELPSTSAYVPRVFDDKVGFFTARVKDYSKPARKDEYYTYINRWDLKKKYPYQEISEPVKPVVYYIDRATPVEYREAIKNGILLWNKAFEKIGFKDAIQCKIMPDSASWDQEDIRYNVIRWQSSSGSGLAGVGPSVANPFTGELLNATVMINSDIVRFFNTDRLLFGILNSKTEIQNSNYEPSKVLSILKKFNKNIGQLCDYSEGLRSQAFIGCLKYVIDNNVTDAAELPIDYVNDYITELVVHEVGHTLGLRHNFKASSAYTMAQISDPDFTRENAIGSSVMDYNPPNLNLPGQKQGQYWSSTLGNYDYFAIEYGYKEFPEAKTTEAEIPYLISIASRSGDPNNVFATDEDAYDMMGPTSIDPLTQIFDLSSSPLEYAKSKAAISIELFTKIQNYFPRYNNSYRDFSNAFSAVLFDYLYSNIIASKYVGGAYVTRMKKGDEINNKYPLIPVSKADQIASLDFINTYLFNADNYLTFAPDYLKSLQPPTGDYTALMNRGGRMDFPLNDIIGGYQKMILYRFYHPILMKRMLEMEKLSPDILTLNELNGYLYDKIWNELKTGSPISQTRRNLQRDHLSIMIDMLTSPSASTPEDARSLSFKYLNELQKDLKNYKGANDFDSFHARECSSRIEKALNSVIINMR